MGEEAAEEHDRPMQLNFLNLGNPALRRLTQAEEQYLFYHKGWVYGADGSRIEDGDAVLILAMRESFVGTVDYFHGCHGGRVIGQMADDESDIFAYQMLPLTPCGYVNRIFAGMQRRWRRKKESIVLSACTSSAVSLWCLSHE